MKAGIISIAPFMVSGDNPEAIFHEVKNHYDGTLTTLKTKIFSYDNGQFQEETLETFNFPQEQQQFHSINNSDLLSQSPLQNEIQPSNDPVLLPPFPAPSKKSPKTADSFVFGGATIRLGVG